MRDPKFEGEAQMGFGQRDHPVQTFPADRADHALTNGIRLGYQLQLVLNLKRQLPSRSRTPFTPGVERSLFS